MFTYNEMEILNIAGRVDPPPETKEELTELISSILAFSPNLRYTPTILIDIKKKIYSMTDEEARLLLFTADDSVSKLQ